MTFITVINATTFSNPKITTQLTGEFFGDFTGNVSSDLINTLIIRASSSVEVDTINEFTTDAGVTIDSILLKDGDLTFPNNLSNIEMAGGSINDVDVIRANTIHSTLGLINTIEPQTGQVVTISAGNDLNVDTIDDVSGAGITVEGVTILNGQFESNVCVSATQYVLTDHLAAKGTLITVHHPLVMESNADQIRFVDGIEIGNSTTNTTNATDTAVGKAASATGGNSIAIGSTASAAVAGSVAIGDTAVVASGTYGVAIGAESDAALDHSVAIGHFANATGINGVAIGGGTTATAASVASGTNSTAIGKGSAASGTAATAVGSGAVSVGAGSLSMGESANAGHAQGVALGSSAATGGSGSIAIGRNSSTGGVYGVALGKDASAGQAYSVAIGNFASSSGFYSLAIGSGQALGDGADATATDTIAMGRFSTASASYAISMGIRSSATGINAVAMGYYASATAVDAVAIGKNASAGAQDVVVIGNPQPTSIDAKANVFGQTFQDRAWDDTLDGFAKIDATGNFYKDTGGLTLNGDLDLAGFNINNVEVLRANTLQSRSGVIDVSNSMVFATSEMLTIDDVNVNTINDRSGGTVTISTTTIALSSTTVTSAGDILPTVTNAVDLGSASLEWRTVYTKDLVTSGDVTVAGDLLVNGNTTTLATIDLLVADNKIVVNSAPSDAGKDGGFCVSRYQPIGDGAPATSGDVIQDTPFETANSTAGSTSTTIVLQPDFTRTDGYYNGWCVKIDSGVGVDQVRRITAFNTTGNVATIDGTWTTTPTAGSTYSVYPFKFAALIWDETTDKFVFIGTANANVNAIVQPILDENGDRADLLDLCISTLTSANIVPLKDSTYNLGAVGNEWNNLFVDTVTVALTCATTVQTNNLEPKSGTTITVATGNDLNVDTLNADTINDILGAGITVEGVTILNGQFESNVCVSATQYLLTDHLAAKGTLITVHHPLVMESNGDQIRFVDGIEIGNSTTNTTNSADIAIGKGAQSTAADTIAMGTNATAASPDTIVIGAGASGTGSAVYGGSVVIGTATATDSGSFLSASSTSFATVAIGTGALVTASFATAIGSASVSAANSVGIGREITVTAADGVAMGVYADVSTPGGIAFGKHAESSGGVYAIAIGGGTAPGAGADATAIGAIAIGQLSSASQDHAIAIGKGALATYYSAIAIGKNSTASTATYTIAIGSGSVPGNGAEATANDATAIGRQSNATGVESIAFGFKALASIDGSIAIGVNAAANTGKYAISIGGGSGTAFGATASGAYSVGIGGGKYLAIGATASGASAVAIGQTAIASSPNAISIGLDSSATGIDAVAIGNSASAGAQDVVVIGNPLPTSTDAKANVFGQVFQDRAWDDTFIGFAKIDANGNLFKDNGGLEITGNLDMGDSYISNVHTIEVGIVTAKTSGATLNFEAVNNTFTSNVVVEGTFTACNMLYCRTVVDSLNTPYTILQSDNIISANTADAAITLNLPQISGIVGANQYLSVKIVDEGGQAALNNITINADAMNGDTILGGNTVVLSGNYNAIELYTDGTSGWFLI